MSAAKANRLEAVRVARLLDRACEEAGGRKAWSEIHGVSQQYICDVLNARREPGKSILDGLGLEKLVIYREISK